ncbi:MAG: hypothetical protein A3J29_18175 [Acidobacteria bacterium RIFCSPLOWO2_12_FULL_67_14b]|nr:MAG: hypothetical protein A3J29_18175 [Acidobacteria bacterium RIFCSPLOWO2_12_FULL_67_14b]
MSFESRILVFSERFLSNRTCELIVAPALADLQFDPGARPHRRAANRFAVLRAVAGGLRDDVARGSGGFIALTLMPACYYFFLLVIYLDFFETSRGFFALASLILVLSLGPAAACFWPSRHTAGPVD